MDAHIARYEARRCSFLKFGPDPLSTIRRVYHEVNLEEWDSATRESRQVSDLEREQEDRMHAEESQSSVRAACVTLKMSRSPARVRLDMKYCLEDYENWAKPDSSCSQTMNRPDASARVCLQHSPIESHEERSKRRRVIESSDRDESRRCSSSESKSLKCLYRRFSTIIWWLESQRPPGKVKGLHSQNDFMRMHGVPNAEVTKKSSTHDVSCKNKERTPKTDLSWNNLTHG